MKQQTKTKTAERQEKGFDLKFSLKVNAGQNAYRSFLQSERQELG